MSEPATPTRRPGRPRSARADAAILEAATELVAVHGYTGLSMEAVAAKAGVGKTTVYRRFPSKRELLDALLESFQQDLEPPDTGSAMGDYLGYLGELVRRGWAMDAGRVFPRLLVDGASDPEVLALVHQRIGEPRQEALRTVLRRGIARGELRADLDLEVGVAMLAGPPFYRLLVSGGDISSLGDLPVKVAETLFRAWSAQT